MATFQLRMGKVFPFFYPPILFSDSIFLIDFHQQLPSRPVGTKKNENLFSGEILFRLTRFKNKKESQYGTTPIMGSLGP